MKLNLIAMIASITLIFTMFLIKDKKESEFMYRVNLDYIEDIKLIMDKDKILKLEKDILLRKGYEDLTKVESNYLIHLGRRAVYTSKYLRTEYKMYRLKANKENELVKKYAPEVDSKKLKSMLSEDVRKLLRLDMHFFGRELKKEID